ncbi:MAG TPA: hypothetical protein VEZ90_14260 [Blastocatellia bacterium]|nr:hypothetical protein [Blastocatellia bacterium]
MISGAAARWLKSRREELNVRFARERRRYPALDPDRVLAQVGEIIPPFAGEEPGSDELCLALFDLLLLHAGRDTLNTQPGINTLFRSTFPALRHLLLQSPDGLPGALCNAVERLGSRGSDFAVGIATAGKGLESPEKLLASGAVLAWRLGEARLRGRALQAAADLPRRVALDAFGLSDWPEQATPLAFALLEENGWQPPRTRVSADILAGISAGRIEVAKLVNSVKSSTMPPLQQWKVAASFGEFSGFGGSFDSPPVVLNGGGRHRFFVRSGAGFYQITADCFGSVCRAIPDPALDLRAPQAKGVLSRLKLRLAPDDGNRVSPDGVLTLNSVSAKFPELGGATSFVPLAGLVAFTNADSHRVRILAPWRPPL